MEAKEFRVGACVCERASVTGQQNLNAISSCCFGPRLYPCQCPRAQPRARAGGMAGRR